MGVPFVRLPSAQRVSRGRPTPPAALDEAESLDVALMVLLHHWHPLAREPEFVPGIDLEAQRAALAGFRARRVAPCVRYVNDRRSFRIRGHCPL